MNGLDIAAQAVHTEQEGAAQCTRAHLLDQSADQNQIATSAQGCTQPQAGRDLERHGQPDNAALHFHSDLVGLYLAQVTRLLDQVCMHAFAVSSGSQLPVLDRALVQAKGHDNGLHRAAMSQQGDHQGHRLGCCAQAIEHRARAGSKGELADMADVALLFPTVHTNVALSDLPSCRTVRVRAKYLLCVHTGTPSAWFSVKLNVPVLARLSSEAPTTV